MRVLYAPRLMPTLPRGVFPARTSVVALEVTIGVALVSGMVLLGGCQVPRAMPSPVGKWTMHNANASGPKGAWEFFEDGTCVFSSSRKETSSPCEWLVLSDARLKVTVGSPDSRSVLLGKQQRDILRLRTGPSTYILGRVATEGQVDAEREALTVRTIFNVCLGLASWAEDNRVGEEVDKADKPTPQSTIQGSLFPSARHFYIQTVPELDEWGRPFEYWIGPQQWPEHSSVVRSSGVDQMLGTEDDLVCGDGKMVARPPFVQEPGRSI